jgi:hypothetical protein
MQFMIRNQTLSLCAVSFLLLGGFTSAVLMISDKGEFFYRAPIEIALVVDGKLIDLNRNKLPENTPIVDKRL